MAIGGFFFVFSLRALVLSVLCALLCALAGGAFSGLFAASGMPGPCSILGDANRRVQR
jgi:hypothetical protein